MNEFLLNPITLIPALIAGLSIVWLTILTVLFLSLKKRYNNLIKKTDKKNLEQILEDILKAQKLQGSELKSLIGEVETLKSQCDFHLQQVGFLRFNPFDDTGGDQSFVLALLDNQKTGILISSLHNRETTRVYSKQVFQGKGIDGDLSEEEQKVITNAHHIKP